MVAGTELATGGGGGLPPAGGEEALVGAEGTLRVMVLGTAVTMPGLEGMAEAQIPAKKE